MEERMIRVAVVEDFQTESNRISAYLEKFCSSEKLEYKAEYFSDGIYFVDNLKNNYDIIILDIEMPLMDGMSAAKKLREAGGEGNIIFVTNLAQYAISGYEVDAVAYLVKPVVYYTFAKAMKKVVTKQKLLADKGANIIVPRKQDGVSIVSLSTLKYIDVIGHDLYFYTENGVVCYRRKPLKEIVNMLPSESFAYCSNHCVVNLQYVSLLKGNTVTLLDKTELDLTRSKKKEFVEQFIQYIR